MAWIEGPPMFSRVMMRAIRFGSLTRRWPPVPPPDVWSIPAARAQRIRHGAPVGLDQQIVEQVRVEVDGKYLAERRASLQPALKTPQISQPIDWLNGAPKFRLQHFLHIIVEEARPSRHAFRQWKARGGGKALHTRQHMPRAASHRQTMAHSLQRAANRRRRPFGAECGTEPHVAGKELVAAVARQHHRHLLPRQLRDDIRGNGRRVAERTVVMPDEL